MANLIPQSCQPIAANIESTTKRLEALQERLQSASTPEKAGIGFDVERDRIDKITIRNEIISI